MKKNKKLLFFTFISLLCAFTNAQEKPVVWASAPSETDKLTGTVTIGGEVVKVTAVVTSDKDTPYTFQTENNKIIKNQTEENYDRFYQKKLDVNNSTEYMYLDSSSKDYPNIITITFDKDVVITEFGVTDITRSENSFSDAYVLEGYDFDFSDYHLNNSDKANVTANSVSFESGYLSGSDGREENWVRHYGHNLLPKGSPLVMKYIGDVKKDGETGVSNVFTAIAVKVSEDVCYAQPASGEAKQTFVGVSTLKRNTEEWLPQNLGAYLDIESKDKGFIITRVADPAQIQSPENGMMVWDTTDKCIKLYNENRSPKWNCIKQGCNK